eukprot:TRINITY_DN11492_c1_g4_i1.p1 TRINITY_DN11492_c1_g4~~TRINITY_DN11492_c1_g4_i1.p1  ORF type:complete len:683 (+),score=145.01 TRINITY_DN11492_c1_g4_i1:290-2050(+)
MALKSAAVWFRHSHNTSQLANTYHMLAMQDHYQGQPHGLFAADECFAGRALNRGVELCAVVETMFSLGIMYQVHGDVGLLDRLELVAYNAWPGTVTPDMWQHQYLQQANEINAMWSVNPHVWITDGPDATGFGVAPNFPCCTTNMQQGWPKFANNIFMRGENDSLVVALLAPASVRHLGRNVTVVTEYPFDDVIKVTVEAGRQPFTLSVRVPSWACNATATMDHQPLALRNGSLVNMSLDTNQHAFVMTLSPEIRLDDGWGLHASTINPINYSSTGTVSSFTLDNLTLYSAATLEAGKHPNTLDICTGRPGQQSKFRFDVPWYGGGHAINSLAFNYSYLVGYTPPPGVIKTGANLQAVLVDAEGNDIHIIYQSPNLTNYSWDRFTSYSPPVPVHASNLNISNDGLVYLELRAHNNGRNLNIRLPKDGLQIAVTWRSDTDPSPGPLPQLHTPATNALAVKYGTLRFALPLTEVRTVEYVWEPFKNVNYNMVTNTTWNFALLRNQSAVLHKATHLTADIPFDLTRHPYVIRVAAVRLHAWNVSDNAASEPPPSPVDCATWRCDADIVNLLLVPYGQTDLRITAFPWLA